MSDESVSAEVKGEVQVVPVNGKLSDRELEILGLLASGLTAEEAGQQLGISGITVTGHAGRIRAKLGARNMVSAVAIAVSRGLIVMAERATQKDIGTPE